MNPCIQCGMCSGSCPYGESLDFTPRMLVLMSNFGEVRFTDTIWLCSSCYLCTFRCPSRIKITDEVLPKIREIALEREVPEELSRTLMNIMRYGNPFGLPQRERVGWVKELEFEVPFLEDVKRTDVLFIPGCYGSYHSRCREVTKTIARLFRMMDLDFAVLKGERCIGDHCRLLGEFGLFEELAAKNVKLLNRYEFNKIVTPDAHAFNSLKNEYPKFGLSANVLHHSQFFAENIENFEFDKLDYKVTYHDPCFIGRWNGDFQSSRIILERIGVELVEMKRNRENALCCGGGGGGIWLDSLVRSKVKERLSERRVREAYELGVDVIVTSCILDIPMFEDAIKVLNLDVRVMDISEIMMEALR
ncbi:MAG: (Fe-S)-binding protein [Archaeoglobales archaeon]|nr:MAG: (Fe-S)-binding protein [Archaeoglobales archaeon]